MISNLHLIPTQATYEQQRYDEIRLLEGTNQGRPYLDTTGNPSVGIGFNLRGNTDVRDEVFRRMEIDPDASGLSAAQQAAESSYLNQLKTAAGSYASNAAVRDAFDAIMSARANNPLFDGITRITSLTTFTMTDPQMQAVFPTAAGDAENKVNAWLAGIPQSNERIALVSLAYNNLIGVKSDGSFKSPTLRQAIIDDERAGAWYEIRYQSNGGASSGTGIANRRYGESDKFGLFGNVQTNEAEAKSILQMYTTHQDTILDYEAHFPPVAATSRTFHDESFVARNLLITNYASGTVPFGTETVGLPSIDGEVLVGKDAAPALALFESLKGTSQADLLLGEAGMDHVEGGSGGDVLYGGTGSDTVLGETEADVLFGEEGSDILQGGGGEDTLFGGTGADTLIGGMENDKLAGGDGHDIYVYQAGDGVDRIEDSDARGMIVVNGQMLVGGIKKANHAYWESPDGTIQFEMSGTDLVVRLNGTQVMTVNENFQNGQFEGRWRKELVERMAA